MIGKLSLQLKQKHFILNKLIQIIKYASVYSNQFYLVNDSDFGQSVKIAGNSADNDLNGGILENGAARAERLMRQKKALNDEIYTLISSKLFQDNYRYFYIQRMYNMH